MLLLSNNDLVSPPLQGETYSIQAKHSYDFLTSLPWQVIYDEIGCHRLIYRISFKLTWKTVEFWAPFQSSMKVWMRVQFVEDARESRVLVLLNSVERCAYKTSPGYMSFLIPTAAACYFWRGKCCICNCAEFSLRAFECGLSLCRLQKLSEFIWRFLEEILKCLFEVIVGYIQI